MLCETFNQITVGVEDIDEPIARSRDIIMLLGILLCIGNDQVAIDIGNSEWREPLGM